MSSFIDSKVLRVKECEEFVAWSLSKENTPCPEGFDRMYKNTNLDLVIRLWLMQRLRNRIHDKVIDYINFASQLILCTFKDQFLQSLNAGNGEVLTFLRLIDALVWDRLSSEEEVFYT